METVVIDMSQSKALAADPDIPTPTGYRLIVAIPEVEEMTAGGLYKPQAEMKHEKDAATTGVVVAMGPDCYQDPMRFPNGPYCKVGDFVMFKKYSGSRFRVNGNEYRVFGDDSIQCVIPNPDAVEAF